jgi:hypothetical protein
MTTKPVSLTWRGIDIDANVHCEPDPQNSEGRELYTVEEVTFPYLEDAAADLIAAAYDIEIHKAILEAVK